MKVKILYLIDSCGGFEDSDDLEDFVEKDKADYHSVKSLEDIGEEEFSVTDFIDEDNFLHICNGRFFDILFWGHAGNIDYYYQNWNYIKDGNNWVLAKEYFKKRSKKKVVK